LDEMERVRSKVVRTFLLFTGLFLMTVTSGMAAPNPYESHVVLAPENKIDELVFSKLQALKIRPAAVCSDAVFVRRVYLDVIGTLPTAFEAQSFILDRNPNKRTVLVDRLLERDEFADYWAMKWSDLLRIKAEFPIDLWPNAAQAYHRWIWDSIKNNVPYDKFVRDLLTANGGNFNVPQVNFYRAMQSKDPQTIAQTVALTFMGVRVERWPREQWTNMAVFFSNVGYKSTGEWKEEIIFFNPAATNANAVGSAPRTAVFPDGTTTVLSPDKDPRAVFADWLINTKNPWFTRNIANRIWSWLLGRGIVQEPDDIRPDNPPCNPELLAYLEQELISSGYDLKHIYRLILNSKTYQLSSIPQTTDANGAVNFAFYPLRRLDAEVLIDALDQLTGSTESYSSAIPEPYTVIPTGQRSIALPDGSITSSFLEMFGRPSRDTGLESERINRITAAQKLTLLNSSQMQHKIEQSRMIEYQTQANRTPSEIIPALYLGILSRFPTEEELKVAGNYYQSGKVGKREATVDLAWALMNSDEFLYRH
jgi:Protein of unknown function (DUF1553)/Protein of unknown function (DUF1549)